MWEALISLPWQPSYSYRYVLVEGSGEDGEPCVDKQEMCDHVLALPEGLKQDDVVEVGHTYIFLSTTPLQ